MKTKAGSKRSIVVKHWLTLLAHNVLKMAKRSNDLLHYIIFPAVIMNVKTHFGMGGVGRF